MSAASKGLHPTALYVSLTHFGLQVKSTHSNSLVQAAATSAGDAAASSASVAASVASASVKSYVLDASRSATSLASVASLSLSSALSVAQNSASSASSVAYASVSSSLSAEGVAPSVFLRFRLLAVTDEHLIGHKFQSLQPRLAQGLTLLPLQQCQPPPAPTTPTPTKLQQAHHQLRPHFRRPSFQNTRLFRSQRCRLHLSPVRLLVLL